MKVLTMIDSLIAAGAERMAVNIANGLSDNGIDSYLCSTHSGGPLEEFVKKEVILLILKKRHAFDVNALLRLKNFVRKNQIDIIHAHSSSVFWAVAVKRLLNNKVKVVWHDHYGLSEHLDRRPILALRIFSRYFDHSFVVNDKLLNFALNQLNVPYEKVSFLANFADLQFNDEENKKPEIPNVDKSPKIVCLANLRPQKDHHNLLDAFTVVREKYPNAVLYLVGGHFEDDYYHQIDNRVSHEERLKGHVHILGSRNDVATILKTSDVGVLSSLSEGLPVSLLEYGLAALPVVCTKVGDCSFVLESGKYGKLVEPANSEQLAETIVWLLDHPEESRDLAGSFQKHVFKEFSNKGAFKKIHAVYKSILNGTVV